MQWIRNLEELLGAREQYAVEYELGSECHIPGLLDYAEGRIICAPMGTEASRDGLWLYNLILRYPTGPQTPNWAADKKGYYFKDGILGELHALLSVFSVPFLSPIQQPAAQRCADGHDHQDRLPFHPSTMQSGNPPACF